MAWAGHAGKGMESSEALVDEIRMTSRAELIEARGDEDELLAHYQARLIAGFQRHLALCREFYRSGGDGPMWRSESQQIDRGIEWCHARLAEHSAFRYQLRGFELEAVR